MRFGSIFLAVIMGFLVLTGCSNQNNAADQNNEISNVNDADMSPDYIEFPSVKTSDDTMKSGFEKLQGDWKCEDKTIKFYIEDDHYKYDDGVYNRDAAILNISIDESSNIQIIVSAGSEQCRIQGKINDDNSVLIIDGNKYKK